MLLPLDDAGFTRDTAVATFAWFDVTFSTSPDKVGHPILSPKLNAPPVFHSAKGSRAAFFRCLALVVVCCGATAHREPGCLPSSNDQFCSSLPPGATAGTSVHINARRGGTISLSDGISITIAPGSLAHSTIVRAALVLPANEPPQAVISGLSVRCYRSHSHQLPPRKTGRRALPPTHRLCR